MDITEALRKELIDAFRKVLPVKLSKLKESYVSKGSGMFDINTITKKGYQP